MRFLVVFPCEIADVAISYQILRLVGEEAEKHDISIHSILQKPAPLVGGNVAKSNVVDFAVITDMLPLSKVKAFASAISGLSFVQGEPLFMPMI